MRQAFLQRGAESVRRRYARRSNAEGLGELDEIRIDQVGRYHAAIETLDLVAPHIAVGIIVEHQRYHADVELHGGRKFLHAEHEAAVAGDRDYRAIRMRDLGAERGRKTRTE